MKILKTSLSVLCVLLVAFLITVTVFNALVAIQRHTKGVQCPTVLGFATAVVISGSMEPSIEINDLVLIRAQAQYKAGDIVTYRAGEYPVTHRIISERVGEDGTVCFTTQGDNNNTPDREEVTADRIIGRVIAILPQFGAAQTFLQQPAGFVLLTAVFAALILLPDLIRLYRGEKGECAAGADAQPPTAADTELQAQIEKLEKALQTQKEGAMRKRRKWGLMLLGYLAVLALILMLLQTLGTDLG